MKTLVRAAQTPTTNVPKPSTRPSAFRPLQVVPTLWSVENPALQLVKALPGRLGSVVG